MKKIIYSLAILLVSSSLSAQQDVQLNIKNYLGSNVYQKNTASKNNLGHDFDIKRLEYYMSQIILIHDGGQLDTFKNQYLLVNPSGAIDSFNLGQKTFTNIEAIQFSLGVEAPTNNGDPTQYFTGHPLAPKSPSMHWGWSAGYRFIAVEGKCGTGLTQNYELHGLWNANYFSVRIPVSGQSINNKTVITLNADYNQIFHNMGINVGVIAHGVDDEDLEALQNMRDSVFSNENGQTDILSAANPSNDLKLKIYPNPIKVGKSIASVIPAAKVSEVKIFNIAGNLIQEAGNLNDIKITNAGLYIITIVDNEGVIYNSKLTVIN